jgi:hypothetical protein
MIFGYVFEILVLLAFIWVFANIIRALVALEFAKNIPPTLQTYAIPAGANINAICGNMKDLLPGAFAAPKAAK